MSGWFARQAGRAGMPAAPPPRQLPPPTQHNYQPTAPTPYTHQLPSQPGVPQLQPPGQDYQSQKQASMSLSEALQAPLQWRNSYESSVLGNCPRCGGNHFFARGNAAPMCFSCGYNGRFEQAQQAMA